MTSNDLLQALRTRAGWLPDAPWPRGRSFAPACSTFSPRAVLLELLVQIPDFPRARGSTRGCRWPRRPRPPCAACASSPSAASSRPSYCRLLLLFCAVALTLVGDAAAGVPIAVQPRAGLRARTGSSSRAHPRACRAACKCSSRGRYAPASVGVGLVVPSASAVTAGAVDTWRRGALRRTARAAAPES